MDEETQTEQEEGVIEEELSDKPVLKDSTEDKLKTVDFDNLKVEDIKVPENSKE